MKIYVCTIIEKNNKYLMIRENKKSCKGKWNFPSGHVEENEYIIDAAKREVKEETNTDVELLNIVKIYNNMFEGEFSISFIFSARIIDDNEIKFNSEEIMECVWLTYEEIKSLKNDLRDSVYILDSLNNYKKGNVNPLDIIVKR